MPLIFFDGSGLFAEGTNAEVSTLCRIGAAAGPPNEEHPLSSSAPTSSAAAEGTDLRTGLSFSRRGDSKLRHVRGRPATGRDVMIDVMADAVHEHLLLPGRK